MTRISLQQAFTQGLRGILNVQSQLFKTQNQISTGKRVLTPADDPVAAARILQLDQATAETAQFQKNIKGAQTSLELEDTQLDSVTNLLQRVRELTVQAGDGALSRTDREGIAAELRARMDELVALANTRNTSGEYVFGGYKGEQAPFVGDGSGYYTYRGDNGQRLAQVSLSTVVPTGDSGESVFVAVRSPRVQSAAAATNTGTATISSGWVADQTAFNAGFTSSSYSINFTSATTYDIVDAGGAPVVAGATYTSGDIIAFNGAEFRITGAPAAGDSFSLTPPSTQSILDTVARITNLLGTYGDGTDDRLRLQDLVAETLDNLDAAETHISTARGEIGARLNVLDSTVALHEGIDEVNQKVLSDVRDLDYAEAITRLTNEETVLQAAQQSFARISNLSLFNFLR
jgi:flagellar hook-associated protein 3 FlgL